MPFPKRLLLSFLLLFFVLVAPSQGMAQTILADPISWDFGDVNLGESSTKIFRLTSGGPSPLTIYGLEFLNATDSSLAPPPEFSIISYTYSDSSIPQNFPDSSTILFLDQYVDLELLFLPTVAGMYEAELRIVSDAEPPNNILDLPLSGTGVSANPVPEPLSLFLFGSGLLGAFIRKRRE